MKYILQQTFNRKKKYFIKNINILNIKNIKCIKKLSPSMLLTVQVLLNKN